MTQDNKCQDFSQEKNISDRNIVRVRHDSDNPYVMLNTQALRDSRLSLDTVGLWARLLCNRNDWVIHVSQLMKVNNVGRDKIYRMLKELLAYGYAYCYQDRSKGKFGGTHWIIFETAKTPEEIEKMFTNTENPYTVKPYTANPPLSNNNIKVDINLKEDSAPPSGASPPPTLSDPPKQKKSRNALWQTLDRKERLPTHPRAEEFSKIFQTPLVGISDQDHEALVAKYGEAVILRAYEFLADWKLSKAEVEPIALKKHTDFHRLRKWALKEMLANPTKGKDIQEENKQLMKRVKEAFPKQIANESIRVGHNYIEFVRGAYCVHLKENEKGFQERLENELRKMNLKLKKE